MRSVSCSNNDAEHGEAHEGMQTMQAQILDVRRQKDVEVVKNAAVELPKLQEWKADTAPLDLADWLLVVEPVLSTGPSSTSRSTLPEVGKACNCSFDVRGEHRRDLVPAHAMLSTWRALRERGHSHGLRFSGGGIKLGWSGDWSSTLAAMASKGWRSWRYPPRCDFANQRSWAFDEARRFGV